MCLALGTCWLRQASLRCGNKQPQISVLKLNMMNFCLSLTLRVYSVHEKALLPTPLLPTVSHGSRMMEAPSPLSRTIRESRASWQHMSLQLTACRPIVTLPACTGQRSPPLCWMWTFTLRPSSGRILFLSDWSFLCSSDPNQKGIPFCEDGQDFLPFSP